MTKDKDNNGTYYSSYGVSGYPTFWSPPSASNPNRDGDTKPMAPSFDAMQRELESYIRKLDRCLTVIGKIVEKTGFNTNAPHDLFDSSRKCFTKLEEDAKVTNKPSVTNELISLAKWELFQKLDPSECRRVLERLKTILKED